MARYKHIDTSPRFLAVDLQRQLLPGTFEYALNHLLDNELDLSDFDSRFNNDVAGATAFRLPCCLKSFCLPTVKALSAVATSNAPAANTSPSSRCQVIANRTLPPSPDLFHRWVTTSPVSSSRYFSFVTSKG